MMFHFNLHHITLILNGYLSNISCSPLLLGVLSSQVSGNGITFSHVELPPLHFLWYNQGINWHCVYLKSKMINQADNLYGELGFFWNIDKRLCLWLSFTTVCHEYYDWTLIPPHLKNNHKKTKNVDFHYQWKCIQCSKTNSGCLYLISNQFLPLND